MNTRAAIRARVVARAIIISLAVCAPVPSLSRQKDDSQVLINVSVIDDKGRPAANLPREAFGLFEEGKEQEITFFQQSDLPVSVAVLFDISGSMFTTNVKRLTTVKEKIIHFIKQSNPSNEYLLVSFSKQAQLLNDWTRDGDRIRASLDQLYKLRQEGGTALYDACHLGIERLKQGSNPKKVLLLISDGQENNSKRKLRDIMRTLKETDIIVYSIVVSDDSEILFSFMQDVLKEFSRVSGGATYYVGSGGIWSEAEITEMFDWIALNLRHQYLIGFRPKALDGKWRSIRVKIAQIVTRDKTKPDTKPKQLHLEARTRQGYYAVRQSADPGIRKN